MAFNTILFPLFFAVCAGICQLCPSCIRPYWLLLASYSYYCFLPENRQLLGFLVFITAITWICGLLMETKNKTVRRGILLATILLSLAPLIYFKQYAYFYQLFHGERPKSLLFPLGLSYFIFQGLGYAIDRYRGKYPAEKNPLHYAVFVSFFPCIFTGPIERYDHLMPQLYHRHPFRYQMAAGGAFRMLWGYFKKMVLAEHLMTFVVSYYSNSLKVVSGPVAAMAAILFALELYLDFSGSCDMAIGGARMMGIQLLENFENPFLAVSYADLWRRWHKSLTGWFRDYVYISLGGNRRGLPRWALNTLIVFAVSGIWHGLSWGYLVWGLACGALVVVEQLPAKLQKAKGHSAPVSTTTSTAPSLTHTAAGRHSNRAQARYHKNNFFSPYILVWLRRALTFTEFSLCFILFAQSMQPTGISLSGFTILFTGWNAAGFSALETALISAKIVGALRYILPFGIALVFFVESRGDVAKWIRKQNFIIRWGLYYLLALSLLFFGVFGQSKFIYQMF